MTDAPDPLPVLPGGLPEISPFAPTSRYYGLPLTTVVIDGVVVRMVGRRFVPDPSRFATIARHTVVDGERPDTVATQAFGDPELFWRLCDANRELRPAALTETVGRVLRVTMPQDIPGPPDA
jgi:hypothetical protein